jgi:hypothetical protein
MRKEWDESEEADEPDDYADHAPAFPTTVRIAGIIWIVIGCVIVLNALATLGLAAAVQRPANPGQAPDAGTGACGAFLPLLFGAAFVFVGQQSVRGTAKDTLGNAIGSIVLGIAPLLCGVSFLVGAGFLGVNVPPDMRVVFAIIGAVNILTGIGLLSAGALALVGRAEYREWQRWQKRRTPNKP